MTESPPTVSVAIPVYNEEGLVAELVRRVAAVLDPLPGQGHEILIVNDGSHDRTAPRLDELAAGEPRLRVLHLSRNFGHQAALTAGLDHAAGDVVVLMDGDLQDPPEMIPAFLEKYAEGYDVVYALRERRKESLPLRAAYFLFYRLLARMANIRIPIDAGDFGLMSRRVVEQVRRADERQRYLRGLRAWAGFRQTGIPVERGRRAAGDSKYSVAKLLRLAFDGMFAFSVVPLRAATFVGVAAVVASTGFAIYAVGAFFLAERSPRGFTATIVVLVFIGGVILFFLGIIGEYVGRVYEEVKGRPVYVIERQTGG